MSEFWKSKEFWAMVVSQVVALAGLIVGTYVPEVHQPIALAVFGVFQAIALGALGVSAVTKKIKYEVRRQIREFEIRMAKK